MTDDSAMAKGSVADHEGAPSAIQPWEKKLTKKQRRLARRNPTLELDKADGGSRAPKGAWAQGQPQTAARQPALGSWACCGATGSGYALNLKQHRYCAVCNLRWNWWDKKDTSDLYRTPKGTSSHADKPQAGKMEDRRDQ